MTTPSTVSSDPDVFCWAAAGRMREKQKKKARNAKRKNGARINLLDKTALVKQLFRRLRNWKCPLHTFISAFLNRGASRKSKRSLQTKKGTAYSRRVLGARKTCTEGILVLESLEGVFSGYGCGRSQSLTQGI